MATFRDEFVEILLSDDVEKIAKLINSNEFIGMEDTIQLILLAKLVNQIRLL